MRVCQNRNTKNIYLTEEILLVDFEENSFLGQSLRILANHLLQIKPHFNFLKNVLTSMADENYDKQIQPLPLALFAVLGLLKDQKTRFQGILPPQSLFLGSFSGILNLKKSFFSPILRGFGSKTLLFSPKTVLLVPFSSFLPLKSPFLAARNLKTSFLSQLNPVSVPFEPI